MICKQFESFLTNIEEYIFDEKKIVTCGWLSKHFNIHSNISKQLLHTFYENNPKKDELCVTYLVIGSPKDEKTSQITIVTEKDLKKLESNLTSITSKHVYSIQRCSELSDVNVLYAAQKRESVDTISKGISAITFDYNERDDKLLDELKLKALSINSNQTLGNSKKVTAQPLSKNKSVTNNVAKNAMLQCCNDQSKKPQSPEKVKESETKTDNKKASIPSMFKNNPVAKKKPTEKAPPPKTKKNQAIGAFFSKVPNKSSVEPKTVKENENAKEDKESDHKAKEAPSPLKENRTNLNICSDNKSNSKVASEAAEPPPVETKKPDNKSKAKAKSNKKKAAKPVKKDDKKRKRLVVLSDSESDNSSGEEEEVTREPTPEPEPTVVPDDDEEMDVICGTPEPKTRKRKKKLVSKTFKTSEGYMVTEKSYIDASCSEEEEEAVPEKKFKENPEKDNSTTKKSETIPEKKTSKSSPPEKKGSPKGKNASPQKTKQASLMSFFKKK